MLEKIFNKIGELIKIVALFIFFSYLILCASYNVTGGDHLFHIKSGEYIVKHKSVPGQDIFSFTMEGKQWVNHEWLYQILIYKLYENFGFNGIFYLRIIIFSLAFFLLAAMILKIDWMFGIPLLFYGLEVSLRRFTVRPDTVSFLFLIIFLIPFVFKKRKILYLLPFIQILWVNIHGFFFLGPSILALYLILGNIKNKEFDRQFYNTVKTVFILTILGCFLTPQPIATILYPFKVLSQIFSGNQKLFYKYIQELESPLRDFSKNYLFFSYLLVALIALVFFKNLSLFYLGLYVAFALFSLNSTRNIYFFVPIGIAICVNRYPYIKDFFLKWVFKEKGFFLLRIIFAVAVFIACINFPEKIKNSLEQREVYITYNDNKANIKSVFFSRDNSMYPQELINFIQKVELPSRMYNSFNIGPMLIFNFFPGRKVFIDGLAEFYGQDFFAKYRNIGEGKEDALDKAIEEYKLGGFIITYFFDDPPPLIKLIPKKGFKCVYFDGQGIIFVKESFLQQNVSLRQHLINFETLPVVKMNLFGNVKCSRPPMLGYFNMAYILYTMGYYEKSEDYLKEILRISPDHSLSYYLLAKIYYKKKDYQRAFMSCRNSLFFNPSVSQTKRLLARIYIKNKDLDSARDILKKMKIDFAKFLKESEKETDE